MDRLASGADQGLERVTAARSSTTENPEDVNGFTSSGYFFYSASRASTWAFSGMERMAPFLVVTR